jgi:hypothetical protein
MRSDRRVVKSGRGNPVPGTYATGTSHPVQFSWHLKFSWNLMAAEMPAYMPGKSILAAFTILFTLAMTAFAAAPSPFRDIPSARIAPVKA